MAHSFSFAIVRIAPDDVRDERINVGVVVFRDGRLDLRLAARIQKIRAISGILTLADIEGVGTAFSRIDELSLALTDAPVEQRYLAISRVGPFALSSLGSFVAQDEDAYEARISYIIRSYVDTEVSQRAAKSKRSRLLTIVKKAFREERVLALNDEDLTSHRIVSEFTVDDGLVADLALKNGVMHVVETVDATSDVESLRKAVADFGVSSLVLERARMKFGDKTTTRLVYSASSQIEAHVAPSLEALENQGVCLINWADEAAQLAFVSELTQLANPREKATRRRKFATPLTH